MRELSKYQEMINHRLSEIPEIVPEGKYAQGTMPWLLSRSMRYSLEAGGKRLRPSMMLAAVEMLGGDVQMALDFACAVEMIHTYSLIHDDLPGMDNDTLRRGRPTNHVVFGEGQAILAGDGLLNIAFETMLHAALKTPESALQSLEAISEIATGAGVTGMIGGQVMDLYCERQHVAENHTLEYIQYAKTSCMFAFPLRAAARLCSATDAQLDALSRYGRAFGLLFQATDDLLDVTGNIEDMGKTLGKDAQSGKLTCISQYGIEGTRSLIQRLHDDALKALDDLDADTAFFKDLLDSMVNRRK